MSSTFAPLAPTETPVPFEEGWAQIQTKALRVLERMMETDCMQEGGKLFDNKEYSAIYTTTYLMCTQQTPYNWSDLIYGRFIAFLEEYLRSYVLPALQSKEGTALLNEMVRRGDNHTTMTLWLKKFFLYLDRFHVDYNDLPKLDVTAATYFKQFVFDLVSPAVTSAILALVDQERNGNMVDRAGIAKAVKIYERMGMGGLDTYEEALEAPLLAKSREFYVAQAHLWLASDTTPTYLIKTERAIKDEAERVHHYLNAETEHKLLRVLEDVLLKEHETALITREGSGVLSMLENDRNEDLARVFRLFDRVKEGIQPVADIFQAHVTKLGMNIIAARRERVKEKKETNDDSEFIKDLLALHAKYLDLITSHMNSNNHFQKALKEAFTHVVNSESVGKYPTAELLASYSNRVLKKGGDLLNDDEVNTALDAIIQLFSYLVEKDIFSESYRNLLAKRLLTQTSANDDQERAMIGKLKIKCGTSFTTRMEGMITDLALSENSARQFETFYKNVRNDHGLSKVDVNVQQLTSGHWGGAVKMMCDDAILPHALAKIRDIYDDFFKVHFSGKKIAYCNGLGSVTLKGNFCRGTKSYDLKISTLQAVVLMAFNEVPEGGCLSFAELMARTNMTDVEVLKRIAHSLSCGKERVLKKIAAGSAAGGKGGDDAAGADAGAGAEGAAVKKSSDSIVRETDSFEFNDAYTSQKKAVTIPTPAFDEVTNTKKIDEDRTFAIEACIVRTMKMRKTLSNQQLHAEVLNQLSTFRPDLRLIKRRIESLIEREYLRRDGNNFEYQA
jgi:cullin 1